jgi:DNA-3-methyladenine glycosylase II
MRIIENEVDIRAGVKALRRRCAVMRRVHDLAGDPPLRRPAGGFEGLAKIVVGQQLSVASAAAIWGRLQPLAVPFTADRIGRLDDDALKAAGLSRPKIATLRALTAAVAGGLSLEALATADERVLMDELTAIRGIGPWTAEIYAMFCLGRADAFAAGDLALQVAAQMAFELEQRPKPAELTALAERWRPWRGVAARLLWAYYKVVKDARSGAPV